MHGIELGALILPKVMEKGAGTSQKNAKKKHPKMLSGKNAALCSFAIFVACSKVSSVASTFVSTNPVRKKSVKKCFL